MERKKILLVFPEKMQTKTPRYAKPVSNLPVGDIRIFVDGWQRGEKRRGCLNSFGVFERLPHVAGALIQSLLGLPAEFAVGTADLSDARADVTGAAANLVDRNSAAGSSLDGINDLRNSVAGAGAQVEGSETLELAFASSSDGSNVTLSQVDN
jgi:hypothetical protein